MKFGFVVSIRPSLSLRATQPPYETRDFLWHGCIFFNVLMTRIMLGRPKILICVSRSIKVVKARDIHQEDCPLHWFIVKNMIVSLTHFREKQVQGWTRRKREALINGTPELLPVLAKKIFDKSRIKDNSVVGDTSVVE